MRGMQNRRFCRAVRAFHTSVLSERERERSESLEQLVGQKCPLSGQKRPKNL